MVTSFLKMGHIFTLKCRVYFKNGDLFMQRINLENGDFFIQTFGDEFSRPRNPGPFKKMATVLAGF